MFKEIMTTLSGRTISRDEIYDLLRETQNWRGSRLKLAGAIDLLEELGLIKKEIKKPYFYESLTPPGRILLGVIRTEHPVVALDKILRSWKNLH